MTGFTVQAPLADDRALCVSAAMPLPLRRLDGGRADDGRRVENDLPVKEPELFELLPPLPGRPPAPALLLPALEWNISSEAHPL
jgi:hypothetical protein